MSRKQPTPPPAGVVKADPPPPPPLRVGLVTTTISAPLTGDTTKLRKMMERAAATAVPAIAPDLLAALRSALAEGCSTEDLLAGVRQARDASVCRRSPGLCTCGMHVTPAPRGWAAEPSRQWTYCADAEPPEAGVYEVAYHLRRPEVYRSIHFDGSRWVCKEELTPYAWRCARVDPPPLRPADRSYLIDNGVPAEWLGAPEED